MPLMGKKPQFKAVGEQYDDADDSSSFANMDSGGGAFGSSSEPTEQELEDMKVKDGERLNKALAKCKTESIELVTSLLERGAKIDTVDKKLGFTALHHACRLGFVQTTKLLIEAQAPVDAVEKDNWTPLMIAVTNGNKQIVQLLLEAGADRDAQDKEGFTAIEIAEGKILAFDRQPEVLRLLQTWSEDTPVFEPIRL